jgi:Uma2 family endonuclease
MVATDVDVRLSDVPLSLRRPDVVVLRCLPNSARLYSSDTVLVVEIVSPNSSFRTDTHEKKADYADAGIPIYLIVFLTGSGDAVDSIEEYRLVEGRYHLAEVHTKRLMINTPIPIDVSFEELISG